ncbi:MAG: hypothetical protein JM58_12235 [Peptococcaceae bacterium BICA1-8]|nr:MAG: hypothetical protein JM58_12235 [Peptococcaceae bacterium BICA1-8]
MGRSPSYELAEFIVNLKFEDIPSDVIAKEKDHILDGIGNGLHGAKSEFGKMLVEYLKEFPTKSEATVWGTGIKTNCQMAAMANGAFSNVGELEDAHHRTKFKPNTILVQAAFAVGEREHSSGKEIIEALIVANEICIRIGIATHVGKEGYARGWLSTSSIGTFGACAIAGRLMGLNVEKMAQALAIAGGQPCGLWSGGLSMGKRALIGRAAENGIYAAYIAKQGITGDTKIFDGDWGNIGDIISPIYEPEYITKELGQYWYTREIGLKCYPTKGGAHSAIDCILDIVTNNNIAPEEIEQIIIRTTTGIVNNKALHIFPPQNFWEAQNSIPFIMAVSVFDKECGLAQFTDEKYINQDILNLGKKVKMQIEPEADKLAPKTKTAFVDVKMQNGEIFTSRIDYCSGEPENPLSKEKLYKKFKNVASYALDEEGMTRVINIVENLDQQDNLKELMEVLS